MISELCQELKNWFDHDRIYGAFEISGGKIVDTEFVMAIQDNQYFRIIGSVFNDGVYRWNDELALRDEFFVGSVWLMAVPKGVIDLAAEISEWNEKYSDTVNTPFTSESFGGYSYTKASGGGNGNSGSSNVSWQSIFASKLNRWRKL